MANNQTAVRREGAYPDWVELYNTGSTDVNLAGWTLSDNPNQPDKYRFPAGTVIRAGGYLVVWCDGLTNKPYHASWSLSDNGEAVSLYNAAVLPQDSVEYGLQVADISLGRVPNGTGGFTVNQPTPEAANRAEATGAPNQLKINEWMASPSNGEDWFELYNPSSATVLLSGLYLSDRTNLMAGLTNRVIPSLSYLGPKAFVRIFADDLDDPEANHTDFKLGGGGEQILIISSDRSTVIDRIDYGAQDRGKSEGRLPDGGATIVKFDRDTPGASNFQPLPDVVINEVLSHTDPPLEDAIELHNPTNRPVDIGNYWLSNSRDDPKKFRIPANTIIPPGGYKVFYEYAGVPGGFNPNGQGTNRSFTLNSANGDQVYLFAATNDASGTLTGYGASATFGAAENGVSFGRYVTSDNRVEFVAQTRRTFGSDNPTSVAQFRQGTGLPNAGPRVGPLVITEIMYHPTNSVDPLVDNNLDEYIEVFNMSGQTVYLYDTNGAYSDPSTGVYANGRTNTWRVRGVVDYNFPTNVSLPPGGSLLLVNFDPAIDTTQRAAFRAKYGLSAQVPLFGPYSGELENNNGSIDLLKPDAPQGPQHPDFRFVPYVLSERIRYDDDDPWPTEPDGNGPALQRIRPEEYGNDPTKWQANAPNPGGPTIRPTIIGHTTSALTLRFDAPAGATYSILYQNTLGGAWTKLTDVPAQAASATREITLPVATTGARFYRLVCPAAP